MHSKGYSLLEMLMVLSLVSIMGVMTSLSLKTMVTKTRQDQFKKQLITAIELTRNEASTFQTAVTLCKSDDLKTCKGDWINGFIILRDDQLIYQFQNYMHEGKLHWRSRLGLDSFTFFPENLAENTNGTFWYCPKNSDNPVWALVINQAGRVRGEAPNRKGEILDSHGLRLTCN